MPPYTLYKDLNSHAHARNRTPSPPLHAHEYTSDALAPHHYTSTGAWNEYPTGTIELQPRGQQYQGHVGNDVGTGYGFSDHYALSANHGRHHVSPSRMDALAAAVQAVSPTFAVPKLRYGSAESNRSHPSNWSLPARMPAHTPFYEYYSDKGPPLKRARSEVLPPVQYLPAASRPATSHVPYSSRVYARDQMVDEGREIAEYQMPSERASADEAQLLLSLSMGRNHAVSTPTLTNGHDSTPYEQQPSHYRSDLSAGSHGAVGADSAEIFGGTLNDYIRACEDGDHPTVEEPSSQQTGELAAPDTSKDSISGPVEATKVTSPAPTLNKDTKSVSPDAEAEKPRQVGWPKGKPRKARLSNASRSKAAEETDAIKASNAQPLDDGLVTEGLSDAQSLAEVKPLEDGIATQGLSDTQSLAEVKPLEDELVTQEPSKTQPLPEASNRVLDGHTAIAADTRNGPRQILCPITSSPLLNNRRFSDADIAACPNEQGAVKRARFVSVPPENGMIVRSPNVKPASPTKPTASKTAKVQADTVCAGCKFSRNSLNGEGESWISCNGCKEWFHFACAGFKNEREVRNVDKFYCRQCKATHGVTTYVRKSSRAHTSVDYARLQEGVVTTSSENPEHHYIQSFKEGKFKFQPEKFPRMRPELVTADYFERCQAMTEPIVIPAAWNPRPSTAQARSPSPDPANFDTKTGACGEPSGGEDAWETRDYEYDMVLDEGQDRLDMVIPQGLTVRRVAQLYGPEEKVEVIDVKLQEGEDKRWNMRKWADYYETEGDKVVRNVISLEVSQSKLGRLIRRPKVVRDLDLQDSVWPAEETAKGNQPRVQFYCLMSVADCYTDFHIDFGGSSVYYHILKGKKTFFFIPPKTKHLKKYEDWCLSPAQNHTFLPDQTKECYKVDLTEGDTMLIPSGWIHAVWTPENSLVIGGNFLTRLHYGMQIRIAEIEKTTKVPRKFRYPHFQKVLWYAVIRYLEEDPLPQTVAQGFYEGRKFHRETPLYYEFDFSDVNARPGQERYNARYYPQAELDSLPDLVRYIFRTVMISLGKVEGVTNDTRNAVTRAIPKGHGEPLVLCKMFAMWTAWKRGNEDIPQWAHADAELPTSGVDGEKKLSAASLKKLERRAAIGIPDRQSSRRLSKALEANANGSHLNTPKTSVLGPARVACDTCRKRRIRCKHKDPITPAADGNHRMIRSIAPPNNAIASDTVVPSNDTTPGPTVVAVVINNAPSLATGTDIHGYSAVTDQAHGRPYVATFNKHLEDDFTAKSGRSRACAECRRSKRRCIHNENGGIDPVKAAEPSVPRGPNNAKKRKSMADDGPSVLKLPKHNPPDRGLGPEQTATNGMVNTIPEMHCRQTESSAQHFGPSYTPHMGPSYTPNMTSSTFHEAAQYDEIGQVDETSFAGLRTHEDSITGQLGDSSLGMPYESYSGTAVLAKGLVLTAMACLETHSRFPQPLALSVEHATIAVQQEPTPPEDAVVFDDERDERPWDSTESTKQLRDGLPSPVLEQISGSEIPAALAASSRVQERATVQGAEEDAHESGQVVAEPCVQNDEHPAMPPKPFEGEPSVPIGDTPHGIDSLEFGQAVAEPCVHNDESPAMSPWPSEGNPSGRIIDTFDEFDPLGFRQAVTKPFLHNDEPHALSPRPSSEGDPSVRITDTHDGTDSHQDDPPTALLTSNAISLEELPALETADTMAVEDNIALSTVKQEPSLPTVPTSNGTIEDDSGEELSPPSSPLTEMSTPPPRVGTPGIVNDSQELRKVQRHSSRQTKQVERLVNQVYEGSYESRSNTNRRLSNQTHTFRRIDRSVSVSVKQTVSKRERKGRRNKVPSISDARSRTASTAATDPAEEESLRLARQLQEHEFGLRRRSR